MFKIISKFTFIVLLFSSQVSADVFVEYNVTGNERVADQTIFNFSQLKKAVNLSDVDLNDGLKNIYDSGFFEEVNLNIKNNILNINVKEYPIIQEIEFKGIKAQKYIKVLTESIELKSKSSFNKFKLKKDVNTITNILRQSGFYFAKVNVEQKINENNTIFLFFNVEMGEKALIKEIKFIGDKKFKSRKLQPIIISEESKFWKFLSTKKYLDKQRTELDKRLLKSFYLNQGYYNVNVDEAFTQIFNKKDFIVTYRIDAGEKFVFNDFEIKLSNDYDIKSFEELIKTFNKLKNTTYSYKRIDSILNEIDKISSTENFEFIDVSVSENIIDGNKINFVFNINESEKFYVEKINILGNNITNEEFIRQQIVVDEGDPFNALLHNKTVNNLKGTNIFKSVKSDVRDGSVEGVKIIDLTVVEKPTGEIKAGAGYGTTGSTFMIGINENNFNGKGIKLNLEAQVTEESLKGNFSYTNPNFRYSDRAVTTSIGSSTTDKEKDFGYKSSVTNIGLGTSFEQYEDFYFSPNLSLTSESLTTTALASANYKKQEGSYFDALFNYSVSYDKRDSSYRPRNGYVSTFMQEIPLVSKEYTIINGYQITGYKELLNESVFKLGLYTRAINSMTSDEDVRVSKRLFIPKNKLKGFKSGKVGPKDGADYVGGNYMATINSSISLPFIFPTLDKIDFALFIDAANLWHVDYSKLVDQSNSIRSAAGLAVDVSTPIGPLSFSLSQPISKAEGDLTESFRFNLGTTF
tara:strand:+ start:431 stop:2674 length:2244 start_codon:yes stop_codon:yes gene_type:complete